MHIVDQIYVGLVYMWSQLDKVIVGAAITAFVVAVLRMKKLGKVKWAEALLCGIFAAIAVAGASFIISILGIPSDGLLSEIAKGGSHVLAGFIGWYGTDRTVGYVEDKIKGDSNGQED